MRSYPVVINSFNQPTYLKLMIRQLMELSVERIVVIDQRSDNPELLEYLHDIRKDVSIIKLRENLGPHWFFLGGMALSMPEYFAYTDADIKFNKNLPKDFILQMIEVSLKLKATKIGFALDISNLDDLITYPINIGGKSYTNIEWEQQFWTKSIEHKHYSIYQAPVDTTFALYRRSEFEPFLRKYIHDDLYDCMDTPGSYRIAGPFSAVHLPWALSNPIPKEELEYYVNTRISIHNY